MAEEKALESVASYYRTMFIRKDWAKHLYDRIGSFLPKTYNNMMV